MDTVLSEKLPGTTALERGRLVAWLDSLLRTESAISVADDLPMLFEESDEVVRRVLTSDGRFAAHAAARRLEVRTPGGTIQAAVIGAVATDPRFRRRGFGTQIIEALVEDLTARGVSLAVLWADVPKFYERLGFVLAGRESIFVCSRESWSAPRRIAVRPATRRDLDGIAALHELETCRVQRDAETWRASFDIPRTDFYVAVVDSRIAAYGVVGRGHDLDGCLHEWGGEDVLLPVLVGGIFNLRTEPELYVMCPPWKRQAARAMEFHGVKEQRGALAMMRVLDRAALLESSAIPDSDALPADPAGLARAIFGCSTTEPADGGALPVPFYLFGLDSM